jgi:thymidylate synthase (FAD)
MKLVKPSFEIMEIMGMSKNVDEADGRDALELIERAGRTCYKSEDKINPLQYTCIKFVQQLNNLGHESVIEHSAMTVKFICDRGVSHELVRHRLCAFSQESTRYCNYKGGVTFVIPPWISIPEGEYSYRFVEGLCFFEPPSIIDIGDEWASSMAYSEQAYTTLVLEDGWTPQQARSVLPNSLKTEIVVTANFREWRHIFKLRCAPPAHPQMREIMTPLHKKCKELVPIIFDDIIY